MPSLLINIDVPDIERACAFYTRAFDLQVGRRLGADTAELIGAQVPIYLLLKDEGSKTDPNGSAARRYARHWTPTHLDFAVPDIEAALARALEAGAKQESAIEEHVYGKLVLLADPFGHGLCLLQFNERGYDALVS